MADRLFIFVDNSNLWIEGKKISGRQAKPPVPSNYGFRIEYGRLLQHVLNGRELAAVPMLYGSEPPPNDSVWKIIRAKGFDVKVFKRTIFNKEKGVDMRMGLDIQKLVLRSNEKATVAIVAGDADFIQVVDDVRAEGWRIEAWYWSNAAMDLKRAVDRFEELDAAIDKIGFQEV
jgi:uncharacterized LabA/DUF88 family protein